jgi:hypothetical protein
MAHNLQNVEIQCELYRKMFPGLNFKNQNENILEEISIAPFP